MGNGCLTSKYGNTVAKGLFTEAAVRIPDPPFDSVAPGDDKVSFVGKYFVTWIEGASETRSAHLVIQRLQGSDNKFNLVWSDVNNTKNILYRGEGMLFDKILVAAYWSQEIQIILDPGGSNF
jgi:hypothetical protein